MLQHRPGGERVLPARVRSGPAVWTRSDLHPARRAVRLGLLADIHEAVEPLAAAVRELRARRVDVFVMLGDVLDCGERAEETVAILRSLDGVGVWGNHDFGLRGDVPQSAISRFSAPVLEYFASLSPWLELGGYRFQHIDPHLDPAKFEDLWQFPAAEERIAGFARSPHPKVVVGHRHRWEIFTPARQLEWSGEDAFRYATGQRHLTVVNAVTCGWCALMDTDADTMEPIRLA